MEASSNFQKYDTKNPVMKYLNRGFLDSLLTFAKQAQPNNILDAGCGEGFVVEHLRKDLKSEIIGLDIESNALEVAAEKNPQAMFEAASVYEIPFENDSFDLVVLSEVLEHLEHPERALEEINRVSKKYVLISVPHEPVWRAGNMARLKYLGSFGNTPGHINHWTRRAFVGLISSYFEIIELKSPLPWTIALCNKKNRV